MSLTITTTLSLSSQSVANNTSTVTWKVKYTKGSGTYNNNGVKYYVNVDGNRVKSGTWTPKKGTTSGTIASGTTTIKHNADGTHAQIRAYAKVYDTGFSPSSADDYSPYLSLPTIKRTFTVSYNANGGTGAPASQTKTYGVNLTLSSAVPTRYGYAFKGWAASSTGAVEYQAGGTYSANSAVTLYAVWELLGNVKIESYSAIRCDENGVAADEGTWGKFTCTYILSGQGVNEGSVTARYRASDVSTWTDITNIIQSDPHIKAEGEASLSVNVSCLISNLSQDKSYLIELTVTDSYGNTAIASDYISQAYFTMDFLAGGKGIGIGTTASCDESVHPNGLLTCAMDADFKGRVLGIGNLMNYISAQLSSDFTLTNSYKQIPLAQVLKNGSLFEISGGGVKCLASGTIEVHATIYVVTGYTANDLINAQVYKNNTGINYLRGNTRAVTASPYTILNINGFIEVAEGDVIMLYARNQSASRGGIGAGGVTKMDIKYIK